MTYGQMSLNSNLQKGLAHHTPHPLTDRPKTQTQWCFLYSSRKISPHILHLFSALVINQNHVWSFKIPGAMVYLYPIKPDSRKGTQASGYLPVPLMAAAGLRTTGGAHLLIACLGFTHLALERLPLFLCQIYLGSHLCMDLHFILQILTSSLFFNQDIYLHITL